MGSKNGFSGFNDLSGQDYESPTLFAAENGQTEPGHGSNQGGQAGQDDD